jgi:hypothetical protein
VVSEGISITLNPSLVSISSYRSMAILLEKE